MWPTFGVKGMASATSEMANFWMETNEIASPGSGPGIASRSILRPGGAHAGDETDVFLCSGLSLWCSRPSAGLPQPSAAGQRLGVWEVPIRQRSGRPVLLSLVAV
jgi:hypothetical protein